MSPMEVMIEELQADQRIPRGISFRKGMRFASEGAEDGPASPNEPADDTLVSGLLHSRATHRYTRSAHGLACVRR
jgi:hypothetical protein